MKLMVNLGKDSYPLYIKNNILSQAASYISAKCFPEDGLSLYPMIMYTRFTAVRS